MKKLLSTIVAGLIFVSTANAQGTWYTDYDSWIAAVTNVQQEIYDDLVTGSQTFNSSFGGLVTSTSFTSGLMKFYLEEGLTTVDAAAPVTFTFTSGNAFAFIGGITDQTSNNVAGNMSVSVSDGGTYTVGSTEYFAFLGYVSNSALLSTVGVTGPQSNFLTFDSFLLGSSAQNPGGGGGGGAVPEPGEYVSMAILGIGLCGMLVRSRRIKKS